jgi:tRNA A-37 threonylcarbamoyl transferase component Bud32
MPRPISERSIGGRYRLQSELGRGGMGTVWAAHDDVLGRDVAIKEVVPPPDLPDEQREVLRTRTLREARAAARISSGAAVTVYDVIEEDGRPWIVMERLDAPTLAQVIRDRGPLPPAEAAAVGLRVVEALEAAHAAGVLHRDVKPSNVLVTADGRAVLTDFGIATLEGDPSITSTGMLVGSPAYMAPERIRGDAPTRASDLWSLGATLFAAVEGRAPFERSGHIATLSAAVTEPSPPAVHAGPLAAVIEGLLVKDPQERIDAGTARAMLTQAARAAPAAGVTSTVALPAFAHQDDASRTQALPVLAPAAASDPPPVGPVPSARPPERPRRGPGLLVPLLLLAALLVGLGGYWALTRDDDSSTATKPPTAGQGSGKASTPPAASRTPTTRTTPPAAATTAATTPAAPTETKAPTTAASTRTNAPAAGVPDGFFLHRDPTGFAVAIPDGWDERREGNRVWFFGPNGNFVSIDQTDSPKADPEADWRRQERSVSQRVPGYELLGIDSVEYNGWPAADWEFLRDSSTGAKLHVRNRGFVTDRDARGYALYWSTPVDRWDSSLDTFDAIAASFVPDKDDRKGKSDDDSGGGDDD